MELTLQGHDVRFLTTAVHITDPYGTSVTGPLSIGDHYEISREDIGLLRSPSAGRAHGLMSDDMFTPYLSSLVGP
jgi:hypothetical protein